MQGKYTRNKGFGGPSERYLLLLLVAVAAWPFDTRCPTGSRTRKAIRGFSSRSSAEVVLMQLVRWHAAPGSPLSRRFMSA